MMIHTGRLIALTFTVVWGMVACAEEPTAVVESSPPAALGDPCIAPVACAGSLLCVDGLCAERGELPEPTREEADVWSYFDVIEDAGSGTLSDAGDGVSDVSQDGQTGPSEDAQDVLAKDVGDKDLASDTQGDGSEDDTTDDVSETDVETEKLLILLKDDSVEAGAGDTFFLLGDGEAWVADLSTPVAGQVKFAEIFLADVSAPESCGRFRFAVWAPDENGLLPDQPTYLETKEHLLAGGEEGQTIPLAFDVHLEPGAFRVGVILEGPCTDEDVSPALMSDASGVVDFSWLWITVDGTPPWVPASVFGVDGRWAIRVILEAEKVVGP